MAATATHAGMVMLQKQVAMSWMINYIQGAFVAGEFLPVTTTTSPTFKWFYNGAIGGMTPAVGENDAGPMIHVQYRQNAGICVDYRERTGISLRVQNESIAWGDVARDNINYLGERVSTRLESLRINAITAAAIRTPASRTFYWEDLSIGGRQWVGGGGAVSIRDDIIHARKHISRNARLRTDTILVNDELAAAMITNVEAKNWDRLGPMAQQPFKDATLEGVDFPTSGGNEGGVSERAQANIGKIAGHEVFVSNAVVLSDPEDETSALTQILGNDVYIFKRGERLGRTVFFETPQLLSKVPDPFTRTQEWQVSMCLVPIVYRPQAIFTLANAVV